MGAQAYLNSLRFAVKHPRRGLVMAAKAATRITDRRAYRQTAANLAWLEAQAQDPAEIAQKVAPDLWEEARRFGASFRGRAAGILPGVHPDMDGGADYEFLYWLTRLQRPEVVIETGVAAGWSSQAFLAALRVNGTGRLHSSDFPLFRLPDPEAEIGCLVEPELRRDWDLRLDGDAVNLPRILATVDRVDLVHYDSDKSYAGRERVIRMLLPKLAPDALIVMDDLHNNSWFYDSAARGGMTHAVLRKGGYYGVLGDAWQRLSSSAAG